MSERRRATRLIRTGEWLAEVDVMLELADHDWAPYLVPEDVARLSRVQRALAAGEIGQAAQDARVFRLQPVASEAA